ncbi:MAG: D-mannonate epimerase, partial [Planctomycetota bacterium]
MLLYSRGHKSDDLSIEELKEGLFSGLDKLGARKKVLAVPPDFTRCHSRAGQLTALAWQYYGDNLTDILVALGTHMPMTEAEI